MNQTNNNFAYRCLPLNIANAHGWAILNTVQFIASWNGTSSKKAVEITAPTGETPLLALSHFGYGVLTFSIRALFRTDPGYDLFVTGPLNEPKDAIQPLSAVVETDWAPFTFTMNWKFTRKDHAVSFKRDEPFCMIFPLKRGVLEEIEPEVRMIKDDKELYESYLAFSKSRSEFNRDLRIPGSKAREQGWQKDYFRGISQFPLAAVGHRTRLKLREFKNQSKSISKE
jgi:Family of unknown function (DUF6065)